jgi:hypothetical protein
MHDEDPGTAPDNRLARLEPVSLTPPGDHRQRLLMQTLSEAQVDFLMQRTPKREIKYRQGRGGLQFAYVEHGYVTERLNLVFGFNWDFEVCDKQILDDEVIVEARLTVRTPGGQTIVKTQFGGAEIKRHASGPRSGRPLSIADDYKAAASDALKKCASLLGIGLDLYGRDRPDEDAALDRISAPDPREEVRTVDVGRGLGEISGLRAGLAGRGQCEEIERLAVWATMDLAELKRSLGVAELSDLTEAKAQRVINRLRELAARTRESDAS